MPRHPRHLIRPDFAARIPGLLSIWSAMALGLGGCATSGPNHIYLTTAASPAVLDLGPPAASIPGIVAPGEQALGLAYDFNTDHLFVRVAPAQVIRVIERPSGKILREMPLPAALHSSTSADLVFDATGKLVATHSPAGAGPISALDAGPRSFVRVF